MRLTLAALLCLPALVLGAELARYVPSTDGIAMGSMLVDVSGNSNHGMGSMNVSHDGTRLFFTPNQGIVLSYDVCPPILASKAFTLCTWIRNWPQSHNNLFRFQQTYVDVANNNIKAAIAGVHFVYNNGLIYFDTWERVTVTGLPTGSAKSTWLHACFAADYTARTHEVFIDGVSQALTPGGGYGSMKPVAYDEIDMSTQFFLTTSEWESGDLSDVRLFDTALNLAQVGAVMSGAAPLPLVGDAACPAGWFAGATLCYKLFDGPLDFTEANAHCNTIGGELARVPTLADLKVVRARVAARDLRSTMIGAQCDSVDKFNCSYVNGDAVRDMAEKYGPNEPDSIPANILVGVNADGLFDGALAGRSFLCSATASKGAATSNLCAPPRSVPKAANAAQSSVFCAWRAGDALPNSTTVPVNDWLLTDVGGVAVADVADITLGQEKGRDSTFDFVEMSFSTPSKVSFLYDGVDDQKMVARSDAVTQAHMTFRVVADTTPGLLDAYSTPFGFLVPFAYDKPESATGGLPVFVQFNQSTIALGHVQNNNHLFRTFQPPNGLSDDYHTLDLVMDGPQQRATLFFDGAEIIRLDRALLDELAQGWSTDVQYTRFGAMRSASDNAALRIADFSVFGHTGIRVQESCASTVPLTGKRFSFGMQCTKNGVWIDTQMSSAKEQCIEQNSSPCDITLNDELVLPSRAPTCTPDGWRLEDNDWLDISPQTAGDFGSQDFRVSFEFRSNHPYVNSASQSGSQANMFVRSAEMTFPWSGPQLFFNNDGGIEVRQTHLTSDPNAGFECEQCQSDWNNWHTYIIEQYNGSLSLFVDGALKGQTDTQPLDASLILPAPVRFGGNHEDPSSANGWRQNADGWMRNIRMDDVAFQSDSLCQDKLLKCRSASAISVRNWCNFR